MQSSGIQSKYVLMNRFEGKNILFIYYKFPPIKGIGTLRNVKFYRSLKKTARKVFVATTSNRNFLPQDHFNYQEKDVVEIPTLDFRTIYHFLTGNKGSLIESRDQTPQKWLPIWKDKFKQSIIARYFDEGGSYFVHRGVQICSKMIEKEKIDVIVSSYLPYDAHKLAYRLKKKFPHLHWVADYRDFFSDPMLRTSPGFGHRQKKHKRILSLADEVTTVSGGIKKRLSPYHSNVHIVRNGIEQDLATFKPPIKYPLFTLAYTGSIYPQAQDATILAAVLSDLVNEGHINKSHIQFVNAGKDGLYWKKLFEIYQMDDILVNRGITSYKSSISIQRKSHLNVLLSWTSDEVSGILTGKLFEYLAAGPPILGIINGGIDAELDKLITRASKGSLFYNGDLSKKNLKKYLLSQYLLWAENKERVIPISSGPIGKKSGIITWQDEFDSWVGSNRKNRFTNKVSGENQL